MGRRTSLELMREMIEDKPGASKRLIRQKCVGTVCEW